MLIKWILVIVRKIGFIVIMGLALVGATVAATPAPVLIVMGGMVAFALSVALNREKQG